MKNAFIYLATLFLLCSQPVMAQNAEIEQISVTPYDRTITRAGKVAFKRKLNLSFKSSGYLKKLAVDEGQFFKKDQLLASLNTEELKADKNAKYSQLLQAKREVNRVKKLIAEQLSSQQDLDAAQTKVDTTREAYQLAYYNLEKAEIHAQFDGVVLARHSELGEFHAPGQQVLSVAATENNLVVKVSLTGSEIGFVKYGQKVQITLANVGRVNGVISKVPVLSNTAGQLYLIEVLLTDIIAGNEVVAGQLAQVEIHVNSDKLVYKVPLRALIEMDEAGQAVLMTKSPSGDYSFQRFTVLNIDSQYLYLNAETEHDKLDIVTQGWQQLKVGEK
ncbi:efflux RND transporter periplasmic adaptor subunit [Thalassotalea sediminis]|uniref:efflux RND transporter periplasmic adaptor subunit n=1 Tax=Thalassotalea sediminis TaxID=1759089 RepID=UPI002572FD37|nr:efflux RND transporter periplasmic adaptor subunit [Thalassotalea sediminis]